MQKICYLLVGVPGSGKSTLAREIMNKNNSFVWASSDLYIDKIANDKGLKYEDVYREVSEEAQKWANREVQRAIKSGLGLIWDQTNVFESARKKKISTLKQNKYEIICLAVELSPEELARRLNQRTQENGKKIPYGVMKDMASNYTRPHYEEGFDEIYLVNDKNELALLPKEIIPVLKNYKIK
jgi:tRNA uridine 5-carbamoylmethylation protein Kti12